MTKPINIAIAEDHLLVRQGMVSLLSENEGVKILFDVSNGEELLQELKSQLPDVILLDIEMPVINGKEALEKIQEKYPSIKVIIVSMYYEDAYISEFISKGARGFLPKNSDIEKIVDAIFAVYEQGYYFDNKVSKALVLKLIKLDKIEPVNHEVVLSEREIQVLTLTCQEKTNQEISEILFLSKRTVEGYRKTILQKTKAKNVVGLVIYAIKNNIISTL